MPCKIINIPVHFHLQRTTICEANLLAHDSPFHQKLNGNRNHKFVRCCYLNVDINSFSL